MKTAVPFALVLVAATVALFLAAPAHAAEPDADAPLKAITAVCNSAVMPASVVASMTAHPQGLYGYGQTRNPNRPYIKGENDYRTILCLAYPDRPYNAFFNPPQLR